MSKSSSARRYLLGSMAGAGFIAVAGMGSAQAALDQSLTNVLSAEAPVEKCVTVAVPTATATVNARLNVSTAGVQNTTQSSTTVSTGSLGTVQVCVHADVDATATLSAQARARLSGTTLNVNAAVTAEAAADVKVTVNGVEVL